LCNGRGSSDAQLGIVGFLGRRLGQAYQCLSQPIHRLRRRLRMCNLVTTDGIQTLVDLSLDQFRITFARLQP
jgi:hypothetical protein